MLDPICTVEQAAAFGYTVTDADLAKASSRMRSYTGQQITAGTSTILLAGVGDWRLPERPVTAVTEVKNSDGDTLASTAYTLRGQILSVPCRADVTVSYSHGHETVPDGLIELCAQIATRLSGTPLGLARGAAQEQAGNEQVTWGGDAWQGVADLTRGEKAVLDRYYPPLPRTHRVLR